MIRALSVVAFLALACLLLRSARVGLAGDYVDPVGKITAQDEALYANTAIHMATAGDWLTPHFMGRYALYKPPLLYWVSALSSRVLGVSRLALRLPIALLCSLAIGLVFLWTAELRSWQAGACAALLIASNHVWHVLGGMCMTDGLLVAFYTAAMYCLFSDPWLESRTATWGFAAAVAAAILTKSIAGVLPLGILGLYWLAAPGKHRPAFSRVCLAAGLSLVLAAPWFGYQLAVHGRWFWTEHIRVEILGFGAGAPPQTSRENHVLFYFLRMAAVDPVLLAVALVAVPPFVQELRRRSWTALMLLCWITVPLAATIVWQYRNISYLLPIVPALAILATVFAPRLPGRAAAWMLILAFAAFAGKVAFPSAPWGLSFASGTIQPMAPLLTEYCSLGRSSELVVVGLEDDLYGSTLPLPQLRYALVGAAAANRKYGMPFDEMGITLTATQFNDLPRWEPVFRQRLHEWGLDSGDPIGTLIVASSPKELAQMVAAHPATDFLLPDRFREAVNAASESAHEQFGVRNHFYLLSRNGSARRVPAWSCRL